MIKTKQPLHPDPCRLSARPPLLPDQTTTFCPPVKTLVQHRYWEAGAGEHRDPELQQQLIARWWQADAGTCLPHRLPGFSADH